MIYLVTIMNFMAVEFESSHGKPKYPVSLTDESLKFEHRFEESHIFC
jgi:hypothetical protein